MIIFLEKMKKFYLYNFLVIIVSFFLLLNPNFIEYNLYLNKICNIFIMYTAISIYILYFSERKMSKIQLSIFLFFFISLLSTILVSKDLVFWAKAFFQVTSISMYTELLIKNNLNTFLKSISCLLYVLIFSNFLTVLLFPNGLFSPEVYLLGYDNSTIVLLIVGAMFICFSSYYFKKRLDFFSISCLVITFLTYYIRWSVGALIGCGVLAVFFVFFYKRNKLVKYFNIKTFFWLACILVVLIVCFDFQKYFSFIIEDLFHKSVNLTGRTSIWSKCFIEIFKHPLFGIGMMDYKIRFNLLGIYHAHSNFLNVILETGIFGFLAYIYLWYLVGKSLIIKKEHELANILSFTLFAFLIMTTIDVIESIEMLYVVFILSYFLPFIIREQEKNGCKDLPKILLVLDTNLPLPDVNGGAVETLAEYYLEANEKQKKFVFDVFSTSDKNAFKFSKKFKFSKFYYINRKSLLFKIKKVLRKILKTITRKNIESVFSYEVLNYLEIENKMNYYDLVLIENSPTIILNLKRKIKGKYILHLHNDIPIISHYGNCLEKYDLVITCSNYIKDEVRKNYLKSNIVNVYNGIDENDLLIWKSEKSLLRQKYNIGDDEIVLGFCGRVCDDKGVLELVEAFKKSLKSFPNLKLVIAGSSFFNNSDSTTPYMKKIVDIANEIKDKIIFTGYIQHKLIGKYYSIIDISIHPSKVNEACPLTILEAQIMGIPIICTNSGGMPELVTKKNAIVISRDNLVKNLENAIEKLIIDSEKCNRMKKESKKNSEKFYLKNYIDAFFKQLQKELKK